jgi:DnaK suppressor protein
MIDNLSLWSKEQKDSLKKETYMSDKMISYFQDKLILWRNNIIQDIDEMAIDLRQQVANDPIDIGEQGQIDNTKLDDVIRITRNQNLLNAIDDALARIQKGNYGYCLKTKKPIGFERLDAWPIADTLVLEKEESTSEFDNTTQF